MRLTLRTMLAYLDDILEPEDAELLGKKISESDFASGLVERIRATAGKPRLGAPRVDGRGMGADPNSVAEYLDNVLPPERVPELEKVCLESDAHLAEVASCHQILTLVLGEAAEVSPQLRRLAYGIGKGELPPETAADQPPADEVAPPPRQTAEDAPAAPPVQVPKLPQRSRREVPEYLRAGQRSKATPLAITLVLAFLLSAVGLRAMGPFDSSHPLMRLFGGGSEPVVAQNPTDTQSPEVATVGGTPAQASTADHDLTDDTATANQQPDNLATANGINEADIDDGTVMPELADPPLAEDSEPPIADNMSAEQSTAGQVTDVPAPPETEMTTETPAADQLASVDPETVFPITTPAPEANSIPEDGNAGAATPTTDTVPPDPGVEAGYVKLSDLQFVVRYDVGSRTWLRLPGRASLEAGDTLRSLPTYRPMIVLTPSVQVVFGGPSQVRLQAPIAADEPSVALDFGRLFVSTAGVAGAKARLNLRGRTGVVTFVEPASELAIEVYREVRPGSDPIQGPSQDVVQLFATAGEVQWQEDGAAAPLTVRSGQVSVMVADAVQTVEIQQPPAWLKQQDLRSIDQLASQVLVGMLPAERPIVLSLREAAEDRRSEVRSLATRCLSHLDIHEPLVQQFDDNRQKSYWVIEFDTLLAKLAESPESATRVRDALSAIGGHAAEDLYRMASLYSRQQLQEGGDRKLVEYLEHDSLPVRVFAFENLRRITNKTHSYRPENSESRRRPAIQEWKKRLDAGEIIY